MQSIRHQVRRSFKQLAKNRDDNSRLKVVNHLSGRNDITKLKEAHFAAAKKSDTLAYPEDAIIDVSNASEVNLKYKAEI